MKQKEIHQDQLEDALKRLVDGTKRVVKAYRQIISALETLLLFLEDKPEELKEMIEDYIQVCKQTCKSEKERVILFSALFLLAFSFTSYYKDTRKNEVDEIF